MADFHVTREDAALMIRAVEALRGMDPPPHIDRKLLGLRRKIETADPNVTAGELSNVCIGLEELLYQNPLDMRAESLLQRLQTALDAAGYHTPL